MSEGDSILKLMKLYSFNRMQKALLALSLVLLIPSIAMAEDPNYSGYQISQGLPPLQGRVVTAPAGTFMTATVQTPLTSEYARPGDRFNATLGTAITSGGSIVLPAGSRLEGQVVSAKKARRGGRNGTLDVRFTTAIAPNGQRIPISARIQTDDGTGILKGGSTKGTLGKAALRTGGGAAAGAALGTAMGAVSGGRVGRGAIYGTAIGGGLGAIYAGSKKGKNAVIPAGQPINIVLDTPVTVTPSAGGYNNGYNAPPSYNSQPQPYGQPATPYNNGGYGQPANPYGGGYGQPANPYGNGGYSQPSTQPADPYGNGGYSQPSTQPADPYGNGGGSYYGQ